MNIKLTPEQIEKFRKDSWLDVDLENGSYLYYECNSDGTFSYGEICDPKIDKNMKRKIYTFDVESLKKQIPTKPDDPSWHHQWPLCAKCGQKIQYEE